MLTDSWDSGSGTTWGENVFPYVYNTFTIHSASVPENVTSGRRRLYPSLGHHTRDLAVYANWGKVDPTSKEPIADSKSQINLFTSNIQSTQPQAPLLRNQYVKMLITSTSGYGRALFELFVMLK